MTRTAFLLAVVVSAAPPLLARPLPPSRVAPAQEVSEEVKRIRQLYLTFQDEDALNACNDYLVTHPADALVLELRARALRQLGRMEDAAKTAASINPQSARVRLLQAECLGMNPATAAQAQSIVDEVAADDPNVIEPHLSRARISLAQGRLKDAVAELNYVRTTKPKLFEAQLLAGKLAEFGGAYDEAIKLYLPLATKPADFERTDPHHELDAVIFLAAAYVKIQRYDDAIVLYEQLTERFKKSPAMFSQLAQALAMVERTADAITALETAVQLAPTVPELRTRLVDLYRAAGRNEDAIKQCEQLLEMGVTGPAQLFADTKLAELMLDSGELDKAKVHAKAALLAAPDAEDVLTINARVREKLGDTAEAKECYRKALAKNALTIDAMYRLGLLLARSEDAAEQAEGKALLERHKKIEPFLLDIRRAQRELELNPRSPLVLTHLAAYLNLAGEYEQARKWAEVSIKMSPGSPSTCIQLGYISANLGDNTSALKYFEAARDRLGGEGKVPKLDEYIALLKQGKAPPLPMGEFFRPAQQKPEDGAAPAKPGDGTVPKK